MVGIFASKTGRTPPPKKKPPQKVGQGEKIKQLCQIQQFTKD